MPFRIVREDIARMQTDAIVCPTDAALSGDGGTDARIRAAAGPALLRARRALGDCAPGDAKLTPGFQLPAKYVIHTVGPVWQGGENGEEETLRRCYRSALALAVEADCASIAFPLIAAGSFGYPRQAAFNVATEEIEAFLQTHELQVTLAVYDRETVDVVAGRFPDLKAFIDDRYVRQQREQTPNAQRQSLRATHRTPAQPEAQPTQTLFDGNADAPAFGRERTCIFCGATVPTGFLFCPRCGVRLADPAKPMPQDIPYPMQPDAEAMPQDIPYPMQPDAEAMPQDIPHPMRPDAEAMPQGIPYPMTPSPSAMPSDVPRPMRPSPVPMPDSEALRRPEKRRRPVFGSKKAQTAPLPAPCAVTAPEPQEDASAPMPAIQEQVVRPVASAISGDLPLPPRDESFSEMLLRLIDERGLTDAAVYKKANVDRRLFSKIRSNPHYRPTKPTAVAFAVALELSPDETRELLMKAGYALSHSFLFDIIIEYFITRGNYNVFEINEALFSYDQTLLGA